MCEILFRGKRKDNGEWVEGFYVCLNEKEHRIYSGFAETDCGDYYPDFYTVDPETVGQLVSGIPDKNGKEIWEGDILEGADFTAEDGGYGVVSFDNGAFEISGNGISGTFHENYYGKEFEVIGNIHDNPELIGGTNSEGN